jgi:hypothetical protein
VFWYTAVTVPPATPKLVPVRVTASAPVVEKPVRPPEMLVLMELITGVA